MSVSKIVAAAASGSAGGAGLDVDEVFSTFLYEGAGGTGVTVNNGIDLSGEGGLVWIKAREAAEDHVLFDTERGVTKLLESNKTTAEQTNSGTLTNFYSTGFRVDGNGTVGSSTDDYVSWTFRKAPKFFDVVTYTGTGSARTVSHNLGSVPGMIIVKATNKVDNWIIYHRSQGATKYGRFTTDEFFTDSSQWNDTAPTDSVFTVNTDGAVNDSGDSYVAYIFAHNNNDGEFGPDSDQDIIKCGSYTPDGSGNATINLGFEPQWLLIKCSSAGGTYRGWAMFDAMRGVPTGSNTSLLEANLPDAEKQWFPNPRFTPTGFETTSADQSDTVNSGNETYIYMAIRRGPLAAPEDATDVFAVDALQNPSTSPAFQSGFPVDLALVRNVGTTYNWYVKDRLRGTPNLKTNSSDAEASFFSNADFDYMDGWYDSGTNTSFYSWMWKRAPEYFDVCCYTGTGSTRTVAHNLGAVPEMMWVKRRDSADGWNVYHSALGNQAFIVLQSTNAAVTGNNNRWNSTSPTESVFTVASAGGVNDTGGDYIAYLFATVDGVSKVGSYTGNATSDRVIDCGFSNGARFVLIKDTSQNGTNWQVFDTARGITSTKAELLRLNLNFAQQPNGSPSETHDNLIEPDSSGFKLNHTDSLQVNASGINYIFYAIA